MWLALHGFTGTGADWNAVLTTGAIAPDLHGHRSGPCPGAPYTMRDVARRVLDLAPERFDLVGYSMGGRVALHAALMEPRRVRKLILFGATPGLPDPADSAARRARDDALADRIERDGTEAFADYWEQVPILRSQRRIPAEILEPMRARRRAQNPRGLADALRYYGTGAMPSVWHRLEELHMPVTLVTGSEDTKFTNINEHMLEHLPNARHIVFDSSGHSAHLEQPDRARSLLLDRTGE